MVVAVYRDRDRLPVRRPAQAAARDDAADARNGHTGVTRERIDPVGGLGRGGEAQLVIITATEGAGGLHGGGLRGECGADRQGIEFDLGTDAAGLQDVAQITGQSVGQIDGAVYLIGHERRQGTSERHARRGLFETCAQRGQVGGIDGDLAAQSTQGQRRIAERTASHTRCRRRAHRRARHPETAGEAGGIALPDLMPLVHARDAAMGKVAAIGSVNPRRGGPVNAVIQGWKRLVSRVLDWHVRDQVEFNRRVMTAFDGAIEALNDSNRTIIQMGDRLAELGNRLVEMNDHFGAVHDRISARSGEIERELADIRLHWQEWRQGWEHKLSVNEIQFLRSVADLQGSFQHRATLMDSNYRDLIRAQHGEFTAALERTGNEIQHKLWADLERMRLDYERLIHAELRMVRQRMVTQAPEAAPVATEPAPAALPPLPFDYARFADKFRGPEEYVRNGQRQYLPFFRDCREVLDIGCGRGEFLELMREAGISARGIDSSEESVALCRSKGLHAETADLFAYLESLPEASLDGIFCSQVVEHLPPERLPLALKLAASRLSRNGALVIETPNPECLAIFATHFYLDPTHTRPVPSALVAFYLEEFGVGGMEVRKLAPAVESMPALAELPEAFREAFFGGLDYAILGRKL